MASAASRLHEVEAVRQARLEAQACSFQLEQAQNELEHLRQHAAALEQHAAAACCAGAGAGCAAEAALQEARLQAADERYARQLTELELAKQLDALGELQWQLECVVAQLGLQPPPAPAAAQHPAQPATPASTIDHMLLLGKVEDLRQAQLQLGEYKRRLARAEAQLQHQQRQQQQQQQQQQESGRWPPPTPGMAVSAGLEGAPGRIASSASGSEPSTGQLLGEGGRQLVGELLNENEALRQRLADAEERYSSLERDYEVELLLKAESQEEAAAAAAGQAAAGRVPSAACTAPCSPARQAASGLLCEGHQREAAVQLRASRLSMLLERRQWHPAPEASNALHDGSGGQRRNAPVSQSMELIARQRLSFRLQEKDKQLAKLGGVVRELEGKLIQAHKRQADLVMKESSWREQEAQDRRIAQMEDEKARLEFAATAAAAEAEAARKEAAAQRRMVKRLQEQAATAAAQGGAAGAAGGAQGQMVELLQKRVKVLEAQNIRLRLHAKSSKEDEELAAAEATAAAARAARQRRTDAGGEQQHTAAAGPAPGENEPPNRGTEAEGGDSILDIPFTRWEADKRLQKRVETLQGRLRDKTTALVSSESARRRAEEQVAQAQAAVQQAQAGLAAAHAQLRQAEQRSAPGTVVPVAEVQKLLLELEQAQHQFNELERQHAALQHRVPGRNSNNVGSGPSSDGASTAQGAAEGGAAAADGGPGGAEDCPLPTWCSLSQLRSSSSKVYRPCEYGGGSSGATAAAQQAGAAAALPSKQAAGPAQPDLAAQLLEKDMALFDAQLQRDQAAAEAERHRRRLHSLLDCLSPHPHDADAAAAIADARQLAGLPPLLADAASGQAAARPGVKAVQATASGRTRSAAGAATAAGGPSKRRQPTTREQELLDTISLLKAALERTKKGLESGVSSSKYMAAVDRAKQLKARCQELEAQLQDAAKVREELARVQRELGALHGTVSALRSQLKQAKEGREEAASARERMVTAQVAELERTLRERDAQMEALNSSTQQVEDEVKVLAEAGLRPADLIQELLLLRPRARELEARNAELTEELGGLEAALAHDMAALQADHELLRQQCGRWEAEIRALCARHGEPLPRGLPG
ncbi:hypothetical protein ABPG75_012216 [Micractinium tetrahymenae]